LNASNCTIASVSRGLVISTPPPSSPVNFAPDLSDPVTGKSNKQLLLEPSWANPPSFKRQHVIGVQTYVGSAREMAFFDPHRQSSVMEVNSVSISKPTRLKLDNLPFLKFQQFMRSQGISTLPHSHESTDVPRYQTWIRTNHHPQWQPSRQLLVAVAFVSPPESDQCV